MEIFGLSWPCCGGKPAKDYPIVVEPHKGHGCKIGVGLGGSELSVDEADRDIGYCFIKDCGSARASDT